MWDRRAKVISVTDGDTMKIVLDQGYGDTKQVNARIAGARAPERGQKGYEATKGFAAAWVETRSGETEWPFVATSVRIKSDAHEVTTVGRYVFYIHDPVTGESLADAVNDFVAARGYPQGY